jgi:hypothetical protein
MENFMFITANNNEVPPPEPRTPTFFGYRTAYDRAHRRHVAPGQHVNFTPKGDTYEVVYNIDGAAMQAAALPRDQMDYFIHFMKEVSGLDAKEKRKPQKGKFRTRQVKVNTDWEVQTAGSTAGEQVRLTHVTKESALRLADLGLTPDQFEQLDGFRQGWNRACSSSPVRRRAASPRRCTP